MPRGRGGRSPAGIQSNFALSRPAAESQPAQPSVSPELARYATLFNAHDWDGVRAMLADDVRLDLVSRRKAAGRREVSLYFGNYGRVSDWHLAVSRCCPSCPCG